MENFIWSGKWSSFCYIRNAHYTWARPHTTHIAFYHAHFQCNTFVCFFKVKFWPGVEQTVMRKCNDHYLLPINLPRSVLCECLIDFEINEEHDYRRDEKWSCSAVDCIRRKVEKYALPSPINLHHIATLRDLQIILWYSSFLLLPATHYERRANLEFHNFQEVMCDGETNKHSKNIREDEILWTSFDPMRDTFVRVNKPEFPWKKCFICKRYEYVIQKTKLITAPKFFMRSKHESGKNALKCKFFGSLQSLQIFIKTYEAYKSWIILPHGRSVSAGTPAHTHTQCTSLFSTFEASVRAAQMQFLNARKLHANHASNAVWKLRFHRKVYQSQGDLWVHKTEEAILVISERRSKITCFQPSNGARLINAEEIHTERIIRPAVRLFLFDIYATGEVIAQYRSNPTIDKFHIDAVEHKISAKHKWFATS